MDGTTARITVELSGQSTPTTAWFYVYWFTYPSPAMLVEQEARRP